MGHEHARAPRPLPVRNQLTQLQLLAASDALASACSRGALAQSPSPAPVDVEGCAQTEKTAADADCQGAAPGERVDAL